MADKKPKQAKTVIDVSEPGKTPPSPNSKSIIVTNRPILKDPMVVEQEEADNSLSKVSRKAKERLLTAPLLETEEPDSPAETESKAAEKPATGKPAPAKKEKDTPKKQAPVDAETAKETPAEASTTAEPKTTGSVQPKKLIVPIGDDKPKESAKADAQPAPKDDQKTEEDKPQESAPQLAEAKTEPKAEPETEAAPAEEAAEPETPAAADTAAAQGKDKPVQEDKDAKEAKRQAAIEQLAESKKYYLPINMVEKRRSKRVVVAGLVLSLLLIVAWGDVALDAGLIHINGVKPVTHFFSN